jgi:Heavy-metal resistance
VKRWWLVLALLLSLGVNVGILATIAVARLRPAAAQKAPQGPPEKRLAKVADRLGLAGEERQRFLALQRRFFTATSAERKRLQAIYRQVRRELVSPQPDPVRLERLLEESSRVYLGIERSVSANVLATRKVLTPEHEAVFLDLIEKLRPGQGPFTQPGAPGPGWNRILKDENPQPPAALPSEGIP